MVKFIQQFMKGDRRVLARLITMVDNKSGDYEKIMDLIYPKTGNSYIVGVTGPPGVGKSTLVNQLVSAYRKLNMSISVLAIDPSSSITNGALLGDRIRMLNETNDKGVYIRSLASHGQSGGLSESIFDCTSILDAFGFDLIVIETVGAGQGEIEIIDSCHTTVSITVPGLGDGIQLIKAGIMEVADVYVVNKADNKGSKILYQQMRNYFKDIENGWKPKVCLTNALDGSGIEGVLEAISDHKDWMSSQQSSSKYFRIRAELHRRIVQEIRREVESLNLTENLVEGIIDGKISLSEGVEKAIKIIKGD